jgi:hypothetical protein
VDGIENVVDATGSREFEVLLPRLRRPRLQAEIESQCAAAGVRGAVRTSGRGSAKRKVLVLTVPPDVSEVALAKLSSWIYVRVGTRPHDLSEAAADAFSRWSAIAAVPAIDAWTSKDLKFIVGRMVRREFLSGVGSICAATGARWEWRAERQVLTRITLITVSGPGSVVDETASRLLEWQRRFAPQTGG